MRIKKEYYVYLSDQNKESFDDIIKKKLYFARRDFDASG